MRRVAFVEGLSKHKSAREINGGSEDGDEALTIPVPAGKAPNVITSMATVTFGDENTHLPCIDLDFPCSLVPSQTPGHYHLFLNKRITWEQYVPILRALADAGILQKGYVEGSIKRKATAVRVPMEFDI